MSGYFVGVGTQKAGTTWLHDQLAAHPQVALPARKELHYFDAAYQVRQGQGFGAQYVRNLKRALEKGNKQQALRVLDSLDMVHRGPRAYLDRLGASATAQTRVIGEITPAYANLTRRGFVAMRHTLQRPRVILTLRDPIDRYWSAVRMAVSGDEAVRVFGTGPYDAVGRGRGDYRTIVGLLDEVFGDAVLYLFFETLFTEDTLRQVARHLGVDETWGWDLAKTSNAGPQLTMPAIPDALVEAFADQYRFVEERFGEAVPRSWRRLEATPDEPAGASQ